MESASGSLAAKTCGLTATRERSARGMLPYALASAAVAGADELRQNRSEDVLEQIPESCQGELGIGFRRPRGQNTEVAPSGHLHGGHPQGGLSDPGLALEEQHAEALLALVQPALDLGELLLTPDDRGHEPQSEGSNCRLPQLRCGSTVNPIKTPRGGVAIERGSSA